MQIVEIPVAQIRPNPKQPRKDFDPEKLQDLARSLKNGQHQPITVRPIPPEGEIRFEIVMGERRWRATQLIPRATIKAQIEEMEAQAMQVAAIVENMMRADVNPAEEAVALRALIDDHSMSEEQICEQTGMAPHRLRERLALMSLDPIVMQLVRSGQLAPTCGVEIAKLPAHRQTEVVRQFSAGKIKTIAEIRAAVTTHIEREAQGDMLGAVPKATAEEMRVLTSMEKKVEQVKLMVATGWKDGECVVAKKVNPNRVRTMAESIAAIRLSLARMERQLLQAATQNEILN